MGTVTPTQRSLNHLRKNGFIAAVVEQWKRFPDREHPGKTISIRQDVFNFVDILAIHPSHGVALVQTTSTSNQASRLGKVLSNEFVTTALRGKCTVLIHGWKKSKRTDRWTLTTTQVLLDSDGFLETKVIEGDTPLFDAASETEPELEEAF